MTKKELFKFIVENIKVTEKEIKLLKKDHDYDNPIESDLIKTKKSMAYENILAEVKKYKKEVKQNG